MKTKSPVFVPLQTLSQVIVRIELNRGDCPPIFKVSSFHLYFPVYAFPSNSFYNACKYFMF